MPNVNDTAPEFTLPRDGGGSVSLAELAGAPVVLFFYPKDDTSGCTKESIAFSDLYPQFQALGVHVFGISKDSVAKHDKFRAKHGLNVPLLSDEGTTTTCPLPSPAASLPIARCCSWTMEEESSASILQEPNSTSHHSQPG